MIIIIKTIITEIISIKISQPKSTLFCVFFGGPVSFTMMLQPETFLNIRKQRIYIFSLYKREIENVLYVICCCFQQSPNSFDSRSFWWTMLAACSALSLVLIHKASLNQEIAYAIVFRLPISINYIWYSFTSENILALQSFWYSHFGLKCIYQNFVYTLVFFVITQSIPEKE